MISDVKSFCRRLRRDRRGAVAIIVAGLMLMCVGFAAVIVDVGYLYHVRRMLQASTDSAALAGAINLASGSTTAVTAANLYSGSSGNKNAVANVSVTATPTTYKCTGFSGSTCTATTTSPNAIKVTETASVPLFFGHVFGLSSVPISATAYALEAGGKAVNTDIMVVLDTTQSMGSTDTDTNDTACSGKTREQCALLGVQSLLAGFTPPTQQVGLMTFPGVQTAAEAQTSYCHGGSPSASYVSAYNASSNPPTTQPPYYLMVGLSSDYKTGSGSVNQGSNLAKAAGEVPGCNGVTAFGGAGTYYANAITAAQNYLTANGRTGSKKMIILLSDGDANSNAQVPSGQSSNKCQEGVNAATAAKTAGMTVISIAYGSPTSGSCNTDTSGLQACTAMKEIATVGTGTAAAPQWFYADDEGTGACTSTNSADNMSGIFSSISSGITSGGARLIPSS